MSAETDEHGARRLPKSEARQGRKWLRGVHHRERWWRGKKGEGHGGTLGLGKSRALYRVCDCSHTRRVTRWHLRRKYPSIFKLDAARSAIWSWTGGTRTKSSLRPPCSEASSEHKSSSATVIRRPRHTFRLTSCFAACAVGSLLFSAGVFEAAEKNTATAERSPPQRHSPRSQQSPRLMRIFFDSVARASGTESARGRAGFEARRGRSVRDTTHPSRRPVVCGRSKYTVGLRVKQECLALLSSPATPRHKSGAAPSVESGRTRAATFRPLNPRRPCLSLRPS